MNKIKLQEDIKYLLEILTTTLDNELELLKNNFRCGLVALKLQTYLCYTTNVSNNKLSIWEDNKDINLKQYVFYIKQFCVIHGIPVASKIKDIEQDVINYINFL